MWQLLFRKTKADFRSRPFQFLLTGLLLTCSAAGVTLGLTVRDAADRPWERAFEAGNGPHMWMSAATPETLGIVAGLPEVAEAGPAMRSASVFSSLGTEQKPDVYVLEAPADSGQFVGKPLMTEGRWLEPAATSPQVVIGAGTARELGLEPGDTWTVGGHGREVTLEVVGVGVLTFRAPYPTWEPVFAYVNTAGFESLMAPGVDVNYRSGARLHDPYATDAVFARLRSMQTGGEPLGLGTITWDAVQEGVNEDFEIHQITFFIFGTLTALASVLVVANTIAGQVIAQSRDISALKTAGMTPGGVLRVFVLENIAVALLAGLLGAVVGIALCQLVVLRNSSLFGGAVIGVPWASIGMAIAVTAVIAALATIVPAWRAGRVPVAGLAKASGGSSGPVLRRASHALRSKPAYSAGLQLVWSSRSRTFLTVTAIAVAVVSSTLLLGFNKLLFDRESHHLLGAPPADMLVRQVGGDGPQALEAMTQDSRVSSSYTYMMFQARRHTGAQFENVAVRGFGDGFTASDWHYLSGGAPGGPGQAVIGWELAERAGLRPGDTFELTTETGRAELTVAGVFTLDDNGGNAVWMPIEDVRAGLVPGAQVTNAGLSLRRGTDEAAFADELSNSASGDFDVLLVAEEVRREVGQFAPAIYTLSAVLLVIAALSVLSSTTLTIRERLRDIASLKAAGMTPGEVARGIMAAVAGLAVAGLAVGVPLGLLVNRQIMLFIGDEAGTAADLTADPSLLWIAALCAVVALVTAIAAFVPARTGGRVSVTEALRYE